MCTVSIQCMHKIAPFPNVKSMGTGRGRRTPYTKPNSTLNWGTQNLGTTVIKLIVVSWLKVVISNKK